MKSLWKNWACKIGCHDWEIVEYKNEGDLIKYIEEDIFRNYNFGGIFSRNVLSRKVCLRCGKIQDEISTYIKNYIENKTVNKNRQKEAVNIINNQVK